MTRIASDMVALSTNEPCCCDLADKGIGRKAPRSGFFDSDGRLRAAWASGTITPAFEVARDGSRVFRLLRYCLIALLVLSLFGFVAWATFGGR